MFGLTLKYLVLHLHLILSLYDPYVRCYWIIGGSTLYITGPALHLAEVLCLFSPALGCQLVRIEENVFHVWSPLAVLHLPMMLFITPSGPGAVNHNRLTRFSPVPSRCMLDSDIAHISGLGNFCIFECPWKIFFCPVFHGEMLLICAAICCC